MWKQQESTSQGGAFGIPGPTGLHKCQVTGEDRQWIDSACEGVFVLCCVMVVSGSDLVMDTGAFLHPIALPLFVYGATAAHLER